MTIRMSAAVLFLVACAGLACAEVNFGESLEWIVADSDRVIVGKIAKVERSGSDEIVTVDVSKTIRGKHEAKVTFTVRPAAAAAWQKAGVPILFCLVQRNRGKDEKNLPDTALVLRHGFQWPSAVLLGKKGPEGMDVFTRDFRVLTDPAAIVKHVEAYAKTIPAGWKRKVVRIDLPFDCPAHEKLYGGSSVIFSLPADAALEAQARKWCKSAPDQADLRSRGVRCLAAFPNRENIAILKGLLTDDNFSTGSGKKYYYIRRDAFQILRDMGVKVNQPVLEEPAK